MKTIKYLLISGLLLGTSACTSVVTIPPTGDLRMAIANANTEDEAVNTANFQARRVCALQDKTIKIVDLDTTYQGIDASQKALTKIAEKILPKDKTAAPYIPKGYLYKATLTFRCI